MAVTTPLAAAPPTPAAPTEKEWETLDNVMSQITGTRSALNQLLVERAGLFLDLTERGVSQSAISERYNGVINQKAISKAILAHKLRQVVAAKKPKTTKGSR